MSNPIFDATADLCFDSAVLHYQSKGEYLDESFIRTLANVSLKEAEDLLSNPDWLTPAFVSTPT